MYMRMRSLVSWVLTVVLSYSTMLSPLMAATTLLADKPIGSSGSSNVPANVLFTPSVEFPTAVSQAHINAFDTTQTYLGYFDPYKCYEYLASAPTPTSQLTQGSPAISVQTLQSTFDGRYFMPRTWTKGVTALNGKPVLAGDHTCNSSNPNNPTNTAYWSGNYLNWATMQTIDTFRMVLTGGDRVVDMDTLTVVQKAYASGQGGTSNFATKTVSGAATISSISPFSGSSLNVRIQGLGRFMYYGGNANNVASNAPDGVNVIQQNVAVAVCVQDADPKLGLPMLELDCTAYSSANGATNYKPEGLIQRNATRMRFGVFSYLNDSNINRDGAVLRSRLKSVGPTTIVPGAVPPANANKEWDPATGIFIINPDPNDATASNVSNSGVINYLNKFGLSGTYKTYDNVSELYYGAIRYLRHKGPVTEWQNGLNATMIDGFPVITSWDDPIQYKCQKNFTVGIGDVNTWRDRNVPGGTNRSNEPTMPAGVSADTDFNLDSAANAIGSMEGLGSIGGTFIGAGQASYYIASMAYWAHVNDIRSDLDGIQTVSFFWVDVMEARTYKDKNQYWLGAKYGGFIDSNGNNQPDLASEWSGSQAPFAYGGTNYTLPNNYYSGGNPQAMSDGLSRAFASITAQTAQNSGAQLSSPNINGQSVGSYTPSYDPKTWTGDLAGYLASVGGNGVVTQTQAFSAQAQLESQASGTGWQARKIATGQFSGGVFQRMAFNPAVGTPNAMTASQLNAIDSDTTTATNVVNYIRGDRSMEGTTFRVRAKLLGTIVGNPGPVTQTFQPYDDGANPGYAAFKSANQSRNPLVVASGNDGMFHMFNGNVATAGAGGQELWAYVPAALYTSDPAFTSNGLANFANVNYSPRYLVNGQIAVQDVDFSNTGDGSTSISNTSPGWHTVAIGGLGKGGRTYTAFDVTDTSAPASAAQAATKVLWEFSDSRMGYSFGLPRVFKTKRYGWVDALTSGYNNPDGMGYVFLVDPQSGTTREVLRAPQGSGGSPIGLAQVSAFIPNQGDYTTDSVYGGDLYGNLWRWDMTSSAGASGAPSGGVRDGVVLATLNNGSPQPITAAPQIQTVPGSQQRYVFLGTGRYLDDTDVVQSQTQSLYGIKDGTLSAVSTGTTVTRANLQATDLTNGITVDPSKSGWYYDLHPNERVIVNPTALNGTVVFGSLIPSNDPCSPAGTSNLYVLSYATGRSQLAIPYISFSQSIVNMQIVGTGSNLAVLVTFAGDVTSSSGCTGSVQCHGATAQINLPAMNPNAVTRLNVREIRPDD